MQYKSQLLFITLCLALSWVQIQAAKSATKNTFLYDPSKSTVYTLTKDNFDKQVTKHRSKLVSVVHYYKHDGKQQPQSSLLDRWWFKDLLNRIWKLF
jgi:hypothetical protein